MPDGRFLVSAALMAGIVIICLVAVVLMGRLPVGTALVAGGAIVLVQSLFLRSLYGGSSEIMRGVEKLLAEPEISSPAVHATTPSVIELWLSIMRLTRYFRRRIGELRAELEAMNGLLAAVPEPLLLVNDRRAIVNANAASVDLLGPHLIGRDLSSAIRHPAVLAASDTVLKLGGPKLIEFELTSPVELHLRARLELLPDDGRLLVTLTDLTTLKRSEELRADFVANASHELRTPLSTIIGFIETLEGPAAEDQEARKRFLPIMHQQARRMARLVDDLLSLSRIELHEHQPPHDEVDIRNLIETVSAALEITAKGRNIRICLDPGSSPALVQGEPDELTQVFQNLIDNAIKYGNPGSEIAIKIEHSAKISRGIAISVRDQGEGIAREHLPRLTERFYRVDSARSRAMGGTGLGLAIVKHIISRHRGLLDVDSDVGQGTVFTVHLPEQTRQKPRLNATSGDTVGKAAIVL